MPSNKSFSGRRAARSRASRCKDTSLGSGKRSSRPRTIKQRLTAIRKLASEAQRCGYVDSETTQAIVTVAGVSQKGRRLGRWPGSE
jgi:hypothetical protein